jgi:ERF superfamily
MKTSETVTKIASALVLVQKEIKNVTKDAENPYFKSEYATLPAVLDTIRPLLSKNGMALIQSAENKDGNPLIVSRIQHESGEFIESEIFVSNVAHGPQPLGSAITYLRRYSAMALLAVGAEEDDDANAAQVKVEKKKQIQSTSTTPVKPPVQEPGKAPTTGAKAEEPKDEPPAVASLKLSMDNANTLSELNAVIKPVPDKYRTQEIMEYYASATRRIKEATKGTK